MNSAEKSGPAGPELPLRVRAARSPTVVRGLRATLREQFGEPSAVLALLVSELVTNAVVHGQGDWVELIADRWQGRVRVDVRSEGRPFSWVAVTHDTPVQNRHGLALVDFHAADWGIVCERGVVGVWFELGDVQIGERGAAGRPPASASAEDDDGRRSVRQRLTPPPDPRWN